MGGPGYMMRIAAGKRALVTTLTKRLPDTTELTETAFLGAHRGENNITPL